MRCPSTRFDTAEATAPSERSGNGTLSLLPGRVEGGIDVVAVIKRPVGQLRRQDLELGFAVSRWPLQYLQPVDGSEWTVESHLEGKPTEIVALYRRFIDLVLACGPFTYAVSKTAITLKGTRRGFAGAKPTHRSLDGYLDLHRRVRDTRIRRSSPYTKRLFVHQFRLTTPDQLDDVFAGWVRDAYAVGSGAHLNREIP